MRRYIFPALLGVAILEGAFIAWEHYPRVVHVIENNLDGKTGKTDSAPVPSPFIYSFNTNEVLSEAGTMDESSSPYFWVNSGAYLITENGIGRTVHGDLPAFSSWRLLYNQNNPTDTDEGYHPQNIFRLLTRSIWQNVREEVYFQITADNLSKSPNRNESNGVLLFSRYQDSDNLYYGGIRVDGGVVIKKKQNGEYSTLGYRMAITGAAYNHEHNPNLIRKNEWVGLRMETTNLSNGSVFIELFADQGETGNWVKILEATDNGTSGGKPILSEGHNGIRTDFMDVKFKAFRMEMIAANTN